MKKKLLLFTLLPMVFTFGISMTTAKPVAPYQASGLKLANTHNGSIRSNLEFNTNGYLPSEENYGSWYEAPIYDKAPEVSGETTTYSFKITDSRETSSNLIEEVKENKYKHSVSTKGKYRGTQEGKQQTVFIESTNEFTFEGEKISLVDIPLYTPTTLTLYQTYNIKVNRFEKNNTLYAFITDETLNQEESYILACDNWAKEHTALYRLPDLYVDGRTIAPCYNADEESGIYNKEFYRLRNPKEFTLTCATDETIIVSTPDGQSILNAGDSETFTESGSYTIFEQMNGESLVWSVRIVENPELERWNTFEHDKEQVSSIYSQKQDGRGTKDNPIYYVIPETTDKEEMTEFLIPSKNLFTRPVFRYKNLDTKEIGYGGLTYLRPIDDEMYCGTMIGVPVVERGNYEISVSDYDGNYIKVYFVFDLKANIITVDDTKTSNTSFKIVNSFAYGVKEYDIFTIHYVQKDFDHDTAEINVIDESENYDNLWTEYKDKATLVSSSKSFSSYTSQSKAYGYYFVHATDKNYRQEIKLVYRFQYVVPELKEFTIKSSSPSTTVFDVDKSFNLSINASTVEPIDSQIVEVSYYVDESESFHNGFEIKNDTQNQTAVATAHKYYEEEQEKETLVNSTVIKAKATDKWGNQVISSNSIKVSVKKTNISLMFKSTEQKQVKYQIGDTDEIVITKNCGEITDKHWEYDDKIVSIDKNNKITALNSGTSTIKLIATDVYGNITVSDTISLTVVKPTLVLSFEEATTFIKTGEILTPKITYSPAGSEKLYDHIDITTTENVSRLSDGKYIGIKDGTASFKLSGVLNNGETVEAPSIEVAINKPTAESIKASIEGEEILPSSTIKVAINETKQIVPQLVFSPDFNALSEEIKGKVDKSLWDSGSFTYDVVRGEKLLDKEKIKEGIIAPIFTGEDGVAEIKITSDKYGSKILSFSVAIKYNEISQMIEEGKITGIDGSFTAKRKTRDSKYIDETKKISEIENYCFEQTSVPNKMEIFVSGITDVEQNYNKCAELGISPYCYLTDDVNKTFEQSKEINNDGYSIRNIKGNMNTEIEFMAHKYGFITFYLMSCSNNELIKELHLKACINTVNDEFYIGDYCGQDETKENDALAVMEVDKTITIKENRAIKFTFVEGDDFLTTETNYANGEEGVETKITAKSSGEGTYRLTDVAESEEYGNFVIVSSNSFTEPELKNGSKDERETYEQKSTGIPSIEGYTIGSAYTVNTTGSFVMNNLSGSSRALLTNKSTGEVRNIANGEIINQQGNYQLIVYNDKLNYKNYDNDWSIHYENFTAKKGTVYDITVNESIVKQDKNNWIFGLVLGLSVGVVLIVVLVIIIVKVKKKYKVKNL